MKSVWNHNLHKGDCKNEGYSRQEDQMQTASLPRMKDRGMETANGRGTGSGPLVSIKKNIPRLDPGNHGDPQEGMR